MNTTASRVSGRSAGAAAGAGPRLRVRLLGDLELRRGDGPPIALPPSRRTRALLGYLVATGAPQSRAALCDLLWDGPDDPRAALRWSLTKLRALVDDEQAQRLRADRDRVAFDAVDCEVDGAQVARWLGGSIGGSIGGSLAGSLGGSHGASALADGAFAEVPLVTLESAAAALQGEFLDGLELPACYRFHHWCMAERERFARQRRAVLEALVARLAAGDPLRALQHGRAMVAADPLAEAAHATLVRLLAAAGRYPEAETHYAWARDLLRREVALPDGGAIDQAIRAVRQAQRQQGAAAAAAASPTPAPIAAGETPRAPVAAFAPTAAPLVGREAERHAIDAALAATGPAPVLLFTGEPGLGKTRLLDHFATSAAALGRRVLRARCFEAEAVRPYGWWLDALRGAASESAGDGVLGIGTQALNREQFFDAAFERLRALAQQQPLALVVDDLQWIDDASAALLHFVTRRLADDPLALAIAAAARAGEIDDNAGAARLVQSLARERALVRHDLGPLGESDVRAWLGDRLGQHLTDVGEAMRASGGNPLFLLELAAAGGSAANQQRPIEALIDERLRPLDDASRDLLGWCAAIAALGPLGGEGGEINAERLAAATALPVADVLGRIATFERHGLLRAAADGGFDFVHGLVRQAVYRSLSTPRRRALHRQLARVFAEASADDPWLHGAVVHHAGLAGNAPLAARAALAAGEHGLRVFANVEAAQVAERGLAMVDALPPGEARTRLEIALLRLRVAAAAAPGGRRLPDLVARIRSTIDAAEALDLPAEASAAWEILAFWRQQAGDTTGAHEATLAAERCTRRADAHTRCRQLANTGRCLLDIESDGERARSLLAEAAAMAAELQLPVMELEWGRGLAARADGDLAVAREALSRAVALARAAANHWREYECMLALATVEYEFGDFDAVLRHADEVAAAAQRMGEAQVPFAAALAALARCRRDGADAADAAHARDAVATSLAALRERDDKAHLAYALAETAAQALAAGDTDAATAQAREALAAASAVRRPTLVRRAQAVIDALSAPSLQAR